MGTHSDASENELEVLLAAYQVERQEEHHSGTSALTLVTVAVAYMTAAVVLAHQCRTRDTCDDKLINLALLLLPLAPVALLGFLALNLVTSALRGRYLVALETELFSRCGVRTNDGLRVPSFITLERSMFGFNGRNLPYLFVMLISSSTMAIIVALFIVGVALSANPDISRWIAMVFYLLVVLCELFIVFRGIRTNLFKAQTRSTA
jgi:hypothetical protein